MLGYLELDTEVSEISMETMEFSKYKEILRVNEVANCMLAATYGKT